MKEVALITLHGMGKVKDDYYSKLEKKLKKILGDDWLKVSFQKVQYAPILQGPQNELWDKIKTNSNNDIDYTKLRKFLLYGFGDAGSLEYSASHREQNEYILVQKEIQRALKEAYLELNKDVSKPVVIIAQSLGCQVISNYLWDAEKSKQIFENTGDSNDKELEFLKLKSLKNLITTGSNIPLFISGLEKRECFKKPSKDFRWDNYYDADDVLGWPLKQLGETYSIVNDYHINSGGVFSSWNPSSHTKYWGDNDVVKPLAKILKGFIN